jgi:hypothetical protein
MHNRIENPQTSVWAVLGHYDHLNKPVSVLLVQVKQPLDQREGCSWLQDLILMIQLILDVLFKGLLVENLILLFQVEERT